MARLIMVIDDEDTILELYQMILVEDGYQVSLHTFWEKQSEVELVKAVQPDLIITDIVIGSEPVGIRVVEQLSLEPQTRNIPLIICTASSRAIAEFQQNPLTKGIKIIIKPFDIEDLLGTVRTLLS